MLQVINDMEKKRWLPDGARRVVLKELEQTSAVVYIREQYGKFNAVAYIGKRGKAEFAYAYKTSASRKAAITRWAEGLASNEKYKAEKKAAKKQPHTLLVEDILSSSWGYDQTNVNFYEVIALKSKTMVTLREVAHIEVDDSHVIPAVGNYTGPEFHKRVDSQYNSCKISSCQQATPQSKDADGNYKPSYRTPWGQGH